MGGFVDSLTGADDAADASQDAAAIQAQYATDAQRYVKKSGRRARKDLRPFKNKLGKRLLPALTREMRRTPLRINSRLKQLQNKYSDTSSYYSESQGMLDELRNSLDPQTQFDDLQANPLFQLALGARDRHTNNTFLAQGLTGDAQQALADNTLITAQPLIQQSFDNNLSAYDRQFMTDNNNFTNQYETDFGLFDEWSNNQNSYINNLFNAVNMGQSAAMTSGDVSLSTGVSVADLLTQTGNAYAAGEVGSANAIVAGRQGLIDAGAKAYGAS